jgi:hypothetical protein
VVKARYSGGFGQPDGFASVLTATVNKDGDLSLTLNYRVNSREEVWTVILTSEQRRHLASMLVQHEPKLYVVDVGNDQESHDPPR